MAASQQIVRGLLSSSFIIGIKIVKDKIEMDRDSIPDHTPTFTHQLATSTICLLFTLIHTGFLNTFKYKYSASVLQFKHLDQLISKCLVLKRI